MSDLILFDSNNGPVSVSALKEALLRSGAQDAAVLYGHSGLNFGQPRRNLSRHVLLGEIANAILEMGVATVCMPTFTFSFCNELSFDRQQSRSQMGALNEHFRKRSDVHRSSDPLMSVVALGKDTDLVEDLGTQSIGQNSTFDKLSRRKNVKFLFLGVHPGDCFTYMHYMEWKAKVPYRYDRDFTGLVIDNGVSTQVTKTLFVRFNGVVPNAASYSYGDLLQKMGHLAKENLGDSNLSCLSLAPAEDVYFELLDADPNHFITKPFDLDRVTKEFAIKNMVAL